MHRSPAGRWPSISAEHACRPVMALAGHTEQPSNHNGDPGHAAVAHERYHPRAGTFDALLLGLEAHHEARLIGERNERQMEGVTQLNQLNYFIAGSDVGRATVMPGIVAHDS